MQTTAHVTDWYQIEQRKQLELSVQKLYWALLKKWACNANDKFDYYLLEKTFSHMNKSVYMYIFMKSSFLKLDLRNCHCIATSIFELALNMFWKIAFHLF